MTECHRSDRRKGRGMARVHRLVYGTAAVVLLLSLGLAAWSVQHLTKQICHTEPCDPTVGIGPGAPGMALAVGGVILAAVMAVVAGARRRRWRSLTDSRGE